MKRLTLLTIIPILCFVKVSVLFSYDLGHLTGEETEFVENAYPEEGGFVHFISYPINAYTVPGEFVEPGVPYIIYEWDGSAYAQNFEGYVFSHWLVNGNVLENDAPILNLTWRTDNAPYTMILRAPTSITAVFNEDADGDGIPDSEDPFPNDPNETADSDSDGVGDNADLYPNYNDAIILNFISEYISNHNYIQLNEVKDLRAGSTMIEIDNRQATLTMEVEESDDLGVWTNGSATSIQIPIDAEAGKKFFRFKMAE